jgi:arabinoxylan arabinofuranohydrolase
MRKIFFVVLSGLLGIMTSAFAGNPIVANIGLDDGHFIAYGDRVYDYASHDYSPDSKDFVLKTWWIWSSKDLVTWTFESSLDPTVLGFPENYKDCWAVVPQTKGGKYYWYVCNPDSTYVVVSDTPHGPWKSPLGNRALVAGRDPAVFTDSDGKSYIVTGVWNYTIAELNDDMVTLKETPKRITIVNPHGPYNLDGKNVQAPTDDKPYLHKHGGKYYLSWGCFYGMADNVYGPYTYKGCFIVPERTEEPFRQPKSGITQDRHGSFFEWKGQTYFNCNDLSSNGANSYWRNTIIAYVNYKDNGEIAPLYINHIGVGQYDAGAGRIEMENYYDATGVKKQENPMGGFEVCTTANVSTLYFPHVRNMTKRNNLYLRVAASAGGGSVKIWNDENKTKLLGECVIPSTNGIYKTISCRLKNIAADENIFLEITSKDINENHFDWMILRK